MESTHGQNGLNGSLQLPDPEIAGHSSSDWQAALPVLSRGHVTLRELRISDASSLFEMLTTHEVTRFIHVPPTSVDAFERFILHMHEQRTNGTGACFAVTIDGLDKAIGLFQIRATETGFSFAEWGFAIGSPFWGTGVFQEGAELLLEFAFETIGVRRLEATVAVRNGRANRALQKVGAVQEGVLRASFLSKGGYLDEALYAILESDWRASRVRRLLRNAA
jgi:RimJ/RimL family protein N-acetyltransferase